MSWPTKCSTTARPLRLFPKSFAKPRRKRSHLWCPAPWALKRTKPRLITLPSTMATRRRLRNRSPSFRRLRPRSWRISCRANVLDPACHRRRSQRLRDHLRLAPNLLPHLIRSTPAVALPIPKYWALGIAEGRSQASPGSRTTWSHFSLGVIPAGPPTPQSPRRPHTLPRPSAPQIASASGALAGANVVTSIRARAVLFQVQPQAGPSCFHRQPLCRGPPG